VHRDLLLDTVGCLRERVLLRECVMWRRERSCGRRWSLVVLLVVFQAGCLDWSSRRDAGDGDIETGDSGGDADVDADTEADGDGALDGDVDGDVESSDGQRCDEVTRCLLSCPEGDVLCNGRCLRDMCAVVYAAANNLYGCAQGSCRTSCGDPELPDCASCLADRCEELWTTCLEAICEPD